jgi:UDP-N-acetylglucosamine 3-dehydrogenase
MTYNIGVIGVGVFGCHSLEQAMIKAGDAQIKKICSNSEFGAGIYSDDLLAQSRAYASKFQSELVSSVHEIVDDPNIDIVSVMTSPKMKAEIILAALNKGKHVVTDKPLAFTVEQAKAICQAEKASIGRGFMLAGYHTRPLVKKLIELIRNGILGELKSISLRLCFMGGVYPDFKPSRQWREENIAGELSTIGSHALITLMKLADSDISSLFSISKNDFYDSYRTAEAEDSASLNLLFESGVVANVFVARLPHQIPNEDIIIEVTGTGGYAEIKQNKLIIYPKQEKYIMPVDGGAVLNTTFEEFFACLKSSAEMPTTFVDGFKLQQALDIAIFSTQQQTVEGI